MKKRITRLEFRFSTPAVVKENQKKLYKKLLATDPVKAEKFKETFLK